MLQHVIGDDDDDDDDDDGFHLYSYYLYLWLKIKLWQDLSQFPDLASLFTFVNCQLKLRQLA